MSVPTAHELLRSQVEALPEGLAAEVLDFVLFIRSRHGCVALERLAVATRFAFARKLVEISVPAAPVPGLLRIEGAPKGAEVYVDDEFKGQVSREGRLKIPGLSPQKHVVRVSAQGYREKVETLDLAPGETRTYTPSLTSLVQAPAAPPAPKPVLTAAGVSVFYEGLGESAKLTLRVHNGDSPVLFVDVNGNGRIDRGDTAYGLTNDERPCTQYLLGPGKTSLCGTFHSRGALEVKNDGDWTRYIWTIPKSELSREGKSAQFVVNVYSSATSKWAAYPSEPFTNPVRIALQ